MQNTTFVSSSTALIERPAGIPASAPFVAFLAQTPFLQGPGERSTFLVPCAQTGGQVAAGQIVVEPDCGPPPHVHQDAEEIFLVQSGAFEILANGELTEARAGDVVYLARGEAHRFRGLSTGEENRFNIIIAPGDFEAFMRRWVVLFEHGAPDMEQAIALCGEYNITLFPSDELAPAVPPAPQTRVIRRSDPVPTYNVFGSQVTVLLDSEQTQGRYSLVRVEAARDFGPPPHVHSREDEMFVIEAGEVEVTLDGKKSIVGAGDMVWAPRGHAHTFRVHSESARMAVFMTPGGFEGYFEAAADLKDFALIMELDKSFGLSPAF